MLTKEKKQKIVTELEGKFKRQKIAIFSDFRGVSVGKSQALRRLLKKSDAEYKVAKKTLFDRTLATLNIPIATKKLEGEIAVVFGYGDEVTPAKILLKFSKENETFKIVGGIIGNRPLTEKEVITLAKLPSREVLLAQLVRILNGPPRGLVTVLQGNIKKLVVVLNAIKDTKK